MKQLTPQASLKKKKKKTKTCFLKLCKYELCLVIIIDLKHLVNFNKQGHDT